jgi:hypothetical protein
MTAFTDGIGLVTGACDGSRATCQEIRLMPPRWMTVDSLGWPTVVALNCGECDVRVTYDGDAQRFEAFLDAHGSCGRAQPEQ